MAATSSSTNTEAIKIQYSKDFGEPFKEVLRVHELGSSMPVPLNAQEGSIIQHTRWLQLPRPTTALSEADTSTNNPAPRTFYTQTINTGIEVWGDYIKETDVYMFEKINPKVRIESNLLGNQSAETIEEQTVVRLGLKGGIPMRADGDATYEKHRVPITTATSTTQYSASSLTEAAGFWDNARIVIDSPMYPGYADGRYVTTHGASGALTVDTAHGKAPTTSSTFSIAVPTALTQVLNSTAIRRAVRQLRKTKVPGWSGGMYYGVIDPDMEFDLSGDDDWKKVQIYHVDNPQGIQKFVIKRLWGVDWVVGTIPYRFEESAPITYNADGSLHSAMIFGKECFGNVDCKGQGLRMIIKNFNETSDPLERYMTMGWKAFYNICLKNSTCMVNLMCAASA